MLALSPYRFDGVRSSENIIGLQDSGVNIAMKIILNFCDASETFEEFLSAATRWARLGSRLSRGLKYSRVVHTLNVSYPLGSILDRELLYGKLPCKGSFLAGN